MVVGASSAFAGAAPLAEIEGELDSGSADLPKSAKAGVAHVMALNIDSGAYGDAVTVAPGGGYELSLPAGKWALTSSVVALGKPYSSFLSAAIKTAAGQHRTLPLTLKRFKKPRRKRGRRKHHKPGKAGARAANVNPRDGRSYRGEAISVRYFDVAGGVDQALRKGIADMLVTELVGSTACAFTVVEWEKRAVIEQELRLGESEWVDPAARVESGHLIDPDLFLRGRIEERPGTPKRIALVAWLQDAKSGQTVSNEVSVVDLDDRFFAAEGRFAKLILRDLICARTKALGTGKTAEQLGPPPPAKPVVDQYSGSFSGSADSDLATMHWTWSGHVVFDAAQDGLSVLPPNGAPKGEYRIYTVTSGSIDISHTGGNAECGWTGEETLSLTPGFAGSLTVQLDVPTPAYSINLGELRSITVTKSGSETGCTGQFQSTAPAPWAYNLTAIVSPGTTLQDEVAYPTDSPFDYDTVTRWNLAPG